MTISEYNKIPAVNFSLLKLYLKSPAHFKWAWDNPQEDADATKAMIIGKAIHTLILEPKEFTKRFVTLDESQRPEPTKNYQNTANREWKSFMLNYYVNQGMHCLALEDYQMICSMGAQVVNNKSAKALLAECEFEEMIEWTDSDTGVKCKARLDFSNKKKRIVGDLKSMEDASPYALPGFMAKWGTHVQLAFYSDGLSVIHGEPYNTQFLIATEKQAPYCCQSYYLDENAVEQGRLIYKGLLKMHKMCVEKNEWPGYEYVHQNISGVIVTDIPAYSYSKMENTEFFQKN